jgi:hypothetical protein
VDSEQKTVGTVMTKKKKMSKETFIKQVGKGEKVKKRRNYLLAIRWCVMQNDYILSTVHDDRIVDASLSKGVNEKTKPLAVMDYDKVTAGVDELDQLLA